MCVCEREGGGKREREESRGQWRERTSDPDGSSKNKMNT